VDRREDRVVTAPDRDADRPLSAARLARRHGISRRLRRDASNVGAISIRRSIDARFANRYGSGARSGRGGAGVTPESGLGGHVCRAAGRRNAASLDERVGRQGGGSTARNAIGRDREANLAPPEPAPGDEQQGGPRRDPQDQSEHQERELARDHPPSFPSADPTIDRLSPGRQRSCHSRERQHG
jgi:hypothetical protein